MPRRPPAKRDLNNLAGLRVGLYCRVSLDADGTEKSVDDQEREGRRWTERQGATLADVYRDSDLSASRYARKERPDFKRLCGDIEAGKLDLVWVWELSRSQRRLDVFAELRDLCRDRGVLWCVAGRVYDLNNYMDATSLGLFAVIGENESEMTAERTRRGKASAAIAGMPAGRLTYGYKRVYHPSSGQFLRQEPNYFDGDGQPVHASPAYVVREIFRRLEDGDSQHAIVRDLNDRSVPPPGADKPRGSTKWQPATIRYIAQNPAYIGRRVHQGGHLAADRHKAILEGVDGQPVRAQWEPLVDEETFWAVQGLYGDPSRAQYRPTRGGHLLGGVVRCGVCDARLYSKQAKARNGGVRELYTCMERGCVAIKKQALDEYVEEVVIGFLSDPAVYADLTHRDDSAAAKQARADGERLRAELATLYQDVRKGAVSPVIASHHEKGLTERIAEADSRLRAATVPPQLAGSVGPDAAQRWEKFSTERRRQIIRAVAEIRLLRGGRNACVPEGRRGHVPVADRVQWRPLFGPGSESGE